MTVCRFSCQTSLDALEMALDFFEEISFNLKLAFAAASFMNPKEDTNDFVNGKSILMPLIGKLSTALCVCAPHNAFTGTLTLPRLSFSILNLSYPSKTHHQWQSNFLLISTHNTRADVCMCVRVYLLYVPRRVWGKLISREWWGLVRSANRTSLYLSILPRK